MRPLLIVLVLFVIFFGAVYGPLIFAARQKKTGCDSRSRRL